MSKPIKKPKSSLLGAETNSEPGWPCLKLPLHPGHSEITKYPRSFSHLGLKCKKFIVGELLRPENWLSFGEGIGKACSTATWPWPLRATPLRCLSWW